MRQNGRCYSLLHVFWMLRTLWPYERLLVVTSLVGNPLHKLYYYLHWDSETTQNCFHCHARIYIKTTYMSYQHPLLLLQVMWECVSVLHVTCATASEHTMKLKVKIITIVPTYTRKVHVYCLLLAFLPVLHIHDYADSNKPMILWR